MTTNTPPSNSPGDSATWDDLYESIRTQQFRLTEEAFFRVFELIRRNLTLAFSTSAEGDHLDIESFSDEQLVADNHVHDELFEHELHYAPAEGVRTKILPTVGRAVTYVPRTFYSFEATDDPEAHQRGTEANYRRAICTATDQAKHQDLGIFASLTFDNDSLDVDPIEEFEKYTRRLRDLARISGPRFHYIAVVTQENGRPHCHALFSRWLSFEDITYNWPHGFDDIHEIHFDEISKTIGYMGDNSKKYRFHKHYFLNSKGDRPPVISSEDNSFGGARQQVEEIVKPRRVAIQSNRPFGKRGHIAYTFEPFSPEADI